MGNGETWVRLLEELKKFNVNQRVFIVDEDDEIGDEQMWATIVAIDNNGFTAMHGAASRGANEIVKFLFSKGAKLDVMSKASVIPTNVDNEPPLEVPGQTPIDAALDADPPRLSTVALIRTLMGEDPTTPMRAPSKKR